jgi:hypothetical protein
MAHCARSSAGGRGARGGGPAPPAAPPPPPPPPHHHHHHRNQDANEVRAPLWGHGQLDRLQLNQPVTSAAVRVHKPRAGTAGSQIMKDRLNGHGASQT